MACIETDAAREFRPDEANQLLDLMQQLACFEGYIQDFKVTTDSLLEHGLGQNQSFKAFVAPSKTDDHLLGMAVTYIIPWTYDLRPKLILKELFVVEEARGMGIGQRLMQSVISHATAIGASRLEWAVLRDNDPAKHFYASIGAEPEKVWETWKLGNHISYTRPSNQ